MRFAQVPLQAEGKFRLATRSSGLIRDAAGNRPALSRQPFLATLGRLIVGELLIHHVDVARYLLGPLDVRAAIAAYGECRGEHAATILLQSAHGGTAVVDGNMAAPGFPPTPLDALDVIGTRGSVRLEGDALTLSGASVEQHRVDLVANYQQGFTEAAAHFVDCVRHGRPFETAAVDNLETLALIDAAYRDIEARR